VLRKLVVVSEAQTISRVRRETLLEGLEDWIGMWEIVCGMTEIQDSTRRREAVLGLIRELLELGWFEAGFPRMNPLGFDAWETSTSDAIARIEREWRELGGDPSLGDIVWFNLTEKGSHEARRVKETSDASTA
jgi:hypothetical protein